MSNFTLIQGSTDISVFGTGRVINVMMHTFILNKAKSERLDLDSLMTILPCQGAQPVAST